MSDESIPLLRDRTYGQNDFVQFGVNFERVSD